MTVKKWICFLLLILPAVSFAQGSCGVFASREDFIDNKVTYTFDNCDLKVRLNKDIVGIHRGEKLRFDFRFIYGYSDGENLWRAYGIKNLWTDHGYYKVIYDEDVVIYKRTLKDARANSSRTFYFFSETKESQIFPLRKKFYSVSPMVEETLRIDFSALKAALNMPVTGAESFVLVTDTEVQKKKPGISARLQTTTRRPKAFSVRSLLRKQERTSLF